jgi:fermentation-respiration switch protein FrsA (DUF1100 family)
MLLPESAPGDRPSRKDVAFPSSGDRCEAWFFQADGPAPGPCVILAHGFDGVREQALDRYAERFAAAGLSALVFDYRYFGASEGAPRQLVSIRAQLEDWRAAIEYARSLRAVDRSRIALWGTSTSGGHVVKVAAADGQIAAVVTQMPFTSGPAQFRMIPLTQGLRLVWAGLKDELGSWLRRPPLLIPAAGRPRSLAVVTSPDALSGLHRITPQETTWRNEVLARFALTTTFYRPGRDAKRLGCPLLVCVADGDGVMAEKPALEMARRGMLRRYPVGHFGMYDGEGFERAVADQVEFLEQRLSAPPRVRVVR